VDAVSTETTTTATAFNSEFIDSLPILGRNHQDVLTLAPGVTMLGGSGFPTVRGARDTSVLKGKAARGVGFQSGTTCRIEAARRSYHPGESIEITVTIENGSSTAIDIPGTLAIADGTARFSVTDDSGAVLPDPTNHTSAVATVRLLPGIRLTLRVILNGLGGFRLDRPGKYRISLLGTSLGAFDSNTLALILNRLPKR